MQQVYQPECRMVVSPFLHFLSFAKNGHFPGHLLSHPAHPPAFPDTSLHTSLSPLKVKVLPAAINYFPPLGPGSPAPPPAPKKGPEAKFACIFACPTGGGGDLDKYGMRTPGMELGFVSVVRDREEG